MLAVLASRHLLPAGNSFCVPATGSGGRTAPAR